MESGQVAAEPNLSTCCISHEFLKAASKSPEKIAVIHASGFARLASDRRRNGTSYQPPVHYTKPSSHPLVYDGYECFTFSDILSAVESTSLRLSRILHGADDDPHLIRPSLGILIQQTCGCALFDEDNPSGFGKPIPYHNSRFFEVTGPKW